MAISSRRLPVLAPCPHRSSKSVHSVCVHRWCERLIHRFDVLYVTFGTVVCCCILRWVAFSEAAQISDTEDRGNESRCLFKAQGSLDSFDKARKTLQPPLYLSGLDVDSSAVVAENDRTGAATGALPGENKDCETGHVLRVPSPSVSLAEECVKVARTGDARDRTGLTKQYSTCSESSDSDANERSEDPSAGAAHAVPRTVMVTAQIDAYKTTGEAASEASLPANEESTAGNVSKDQRQRSQAETPPCRERLSLRPPVGVLCPGLPLPVGWVDDTDQSRSPTRGQRPLNGLLKRAGVSAVSSAPLWPTFRALSNWDYQNWLSNEDLASRCALARRVSEGPGGPVTLLSISVLLALEKSLPRGTLFSIDVLNATESLEDVCFPRYYRRGAIVNAEPHGILVRVELLDAIPTKHLPSPETLSRHHSSTHRLPLSLPDAGFTESIGGKTEEAAIEPQSAPLLEIEVADERRALASVDETAAAGAQATPACPQRDICESFVMRIGVRDRKEHGNAEETVWVKIQKRNRRLAYLRQELLGKYSIAALRTTFGLLVPMYAGRVREISSEVLGTSNKSLLLNYVEVISALPHSLMSVGESSPEEWSYGFKRILQLGAHLSAAGVVHGNITRATLAVDVTGTIYLSDFDKWLPKGVTFKCSEKFALVRGPPEVVQKALSPGKLDCVATCAADAWEWGTLLFEWLCNTENVFPSVYHARSYQEKLQAMARLGRTATIEKEMNWSACWRLPSEYREIIIGLLNPRPESRLDPLNIFAEHSIYDRNRRF